MSKKEQRAAALAARRAMSPEAREAAAAAICDRLAELPETRRAKTVLSYMALADEVDLSALHDALSARGVCLLFPLCLPGGNMEAREACGWRTGPYGIREPDPDRSPLASPEEIDLVVAPCVAFDARRNRLGRGAGYYDRFLPRCTKAAVVAAAFECQRLPQVICEEHDRRMDAVVTETGVY